MALQAPWLRPGGGFRARKLCLATFDENPPEKCSIPWVGSHPKAKQGLRTALRASFAKHQVRSVKFQAFHSKARCEENALENRALQRVWQAAAAWITAAGCRKSSACTAGAHSLPTIGIKPPWRRRRAESRRHAGKLERSAHPSRTRRTSMARNPMLESLEPVPKQEYVRNGLAHGQRSAAACQLLKALRTLRAVPFLFSIKS